MKRPELLAPAGNFEKLKSAVYFGADAVYLAGKNFGMRVASGNFTDAELKDAVRYAHERGVKVYVTVNIMPRDQEYETLRTYIQYLDAICADAVIVSDIGVVELVRECAPDMEIHISTQASAVSAHACMAWHRLGAKRIVLARELSLETIREIRATLPEEVELEAFVHGSMCIAYSGRCLLSQYYVGRDANRGACAQPCRWIYHQSNGMTGACLGIAEEKRTDEVIPVIEDGGDTFVMSSKDMCMIAHVPELIEAGISSLKLEGRVRSAYYTAVVSNTYRMAIDSYFSGSRFNPLWKRELDSVSHRQYGTGFFFTDPHEDANVVEEPGYLREKAFLGTALEDSKQDGSVLFIQRNKFVRGATAELLTPGQTGRAFVTEHLVNENSEIIDATPHPDMRYKLIVPFPVKKGDIIREG